MARDKIPASVSDVLLHTKENEQGDERVVLPFTRYKNVLNAPKVVTGANEVLGAPFALLATETETCSVEYIRKHCGGIM